MTSVLTLLASRKLEAAREKALHHLHERRETIELIRRVEAVAAHKFSWDWSKVESEDVSDGVVNDSDYLAVLGINDKVLKLNEQLMRNAKAEMGTLRKQRSDCVDQLQQKIKKLCSTADDAKVKAKNDFKKSNEDAKALEEHRSYPKQPQLSENIVAGCGLGCLTWVVGYLIVVIILFLGRDTAIDKPGTGSFALALLYIAVLLVSIGTPTAAFLSWKRECDKIDRAKENQSMNIKSNARYNHSNEMEAIEKLIAEENEIRKVALPHAQALLAKAEAAFAILR